MAGPSPAVPALLFYSYSHKDERLRQQLESHLSTLKREQLISGWHDQEITAGTRWRGAIDKHLKSAKVILLLVSADFIASDYCNDVELKHAMEQDKRGDARVIPVILRPCDWKNTTFASLQALPNNGKPVVRWTSRDEAFLNVAEGIRKALVEMRAAKSSRGVEWVVEIKAQLGSLDQSTIQKIVDFLRDQTGDAHLTLRRIEKGSVRFVLEGSGEGVTRILNLYKRGLVKTILGFEVTAILALHQLPAPPADFTGRATELAELLQAVKTGGVTISGLQGMGGVGKTALALKLAEHLKDEYPDAQFYLDLKGVSPKPIEPRDAMAHVIRSYHLTAQLPEKEDEMAALYRSVLDGKRALLLMDNARDAEQVRPLIPPSGCLLLVTSRQHFTLPGLVERNLDRLPPEDARALLLRIAPRLKKENAEQMDELARLCGHLPLALCTVASALHTKKNVSPADYAHRLADTRERLKLTAAETVLHSSYALLSAELQQKFRFLAVFPDGLDLAAAAAAWEVAPESAQDLLSGLLAYSLVEFDETSNRYRLHDLVRLFANQLLNAEERMAAQKRHAEHYLAVLGVANQIYKQGGQSVTGGLALFDLEWTNIQAGQAWSAAHADRDKDAAEWCFRYSHDGVYCLSLRQHPRERIHWLEVALSAARPLNRRDWVAVTLGNIGLAHNRLGEYRHAIEYSQEALELNRESGNHLGEGAALGNLGTAYHSLGEYRRGIEYQEQRLQIVRAIGDRLGEGESLCNLGRAYLSMGEYWRAIEYQEQSLEISREIGDRRGEGAALGNLGIAYLSLGENRRAIECQEQRLQIVREIGDRVGEGHALANLGLAYANLGERRRAIEYQEQSVQIAREMGDRMGEGQALFNSAFVLYELGRRREAVTRAEAALKIFEAIESPNASAVRELLGKWRKEK